MTGLEEFKPQIESWKKYQGKFGWVLWVLAVLLGIYFFNGLAPTLLDFFTNLTNIVYQALFAVAGVVALGAIGFACYVLSGWFMITRDNLKLRAEIAAIKADPFGTAQVQINKAKDRIATMGRHIANLKGAIEKLIAKIQQYTKEQQQKLTNAKLATQSMAKVSPDSPEYRQLQAQRDSNVTMAENRRNAIDRLTPNKVRAEQLYAFLIEFRTLTINKITVSQDQLELAKDEFNINTESRDAIMAAQGMLEGVEKERFEQSMNIIHSNISQMVGEINYVMEMTQPILDAQRFEDGMAL
jgi:hypothetical protein